MIITLLIVLFSLIVGLVFGYMIFHDSPENYDYEVKIGLNQYLLKFKAKKTEILDYCDSISKNKYTVIQLKEEDM